MFIIQLKTYKGVQSQSHPITLSPKVIFLVSGSTCSTMPRVLDDVLNYPKVGTLTAVTVVTTDPTGLQEYISRTEESEIVAEIVQNTFEVVLPEEKVRGIQDLEGVRAVNIDGPIRFE